MRKAEDDYRAAAATTTVSPRKAVAASSKLPGRRDQPLGVAAMKSGGARRKKGVRDSRGNADAVQDGSDGRNVDAVACIGDRRDTKEVDVFCIQHATSENRFLGSLFGTARFLETDISETPHAKPDLNYEVRYYPSVFLRVDPRT